LIVSKFIARMSKIYKLYFLENAKYFTSPPLLLPLGELGRGEGD